MHTPDLFLPQLRHHCRPTDRCRTPIEAHLLERLGGQPWTGPDETGTALAAAKDLYGYLRIALGHKGLDSRRWLTVDTAKTAKTIKNAGIAAMGGVTVLPARGAAAAWADCPTALQAAFAAALGSTRAELGHFLRLSVCPHATPGCTKACVMTQGQSRLNHNELTQLARTLLLLVHPAAYCELTHHHLTLLAETHGRDNVRWRSNFADDIRWEDLCPGLFGIVPAVTYTKFLPCCRPERPDVELRIVYSASERWTHDDIQDVVAAGHSVAVVFDRTPGNLPQAHNGIPVVDGDWSDDLLGHPYGAIVGLGIKGNTAAVRDHLRASGFARNPGEA